MIRTFFRLAGQGLRDLGSNPWAQVLTLVAVTMVTFLSGLFLMALCTLNYQLGTLRGETAFQVYWQQGASMDEVRVEWEQLKGLPGYTSMKTYTPQQALIELGKRLGRTSSKKDIPFPSIAERNPLPATALVFFYPNESNIEQWLRETERFLREMPKVDRVVATPLRDELGQAWRKVSQYIMWPAIVFLNLVLGLVVGNTIRLSLMSRSHEVEILQLIGAYNWYIRLPLVVGGAFQGFVGGALALAMLRFIHLQVSDVLNFPPLLMEIQFLPWSLCLALVLVPMFMGIVASWVAVRDE